MGYTRALLVEPHRDRKKRSKAYEPKDFMLYGQKQEKSNDQEMLDYVKNVLTPYFNAKDVTEKREILQKAGR